MCNLMIEHRSNKLKNATKPLVDLECDLSKKEVRHLKHSQEMAQVPG